MAQFDVHRTKGPNRVVTPYVVTVQSRRFDRFGRRVVIPLVDTTANPPIEPTLNPSFAIEDRTVVLHPLNTVSVPLDSLGPFVCSLESHGDRIIAAIDLLISRAWG
ncbi:CcdB family protein [Azospirillum himalayense]|uniref:Toxin CcdB n=1 Tax=Azospirillum himalayense TaxID=654847 RepID=A0ABW0GHK6_9PROT